MTAQSDACFWSAWGACAILSASGRSALPGVRVGTGRRAAGRAGHRQHQGGARHDLGDDHRVHGVLHEPRLRDGRVRPVPGEEHGQHSVQELHRVRGVVARVSRSSAGASCSATATASSACSGLWMVGGADNSPMTRRRLPGRLHVDRLDDRRRSGRSSSSSSSSPARRPRSCRARSPNASSSCRSSCSRFVLVGFIYPIDRALDLGRRLPRRRRACSTSPDRRSCIRPAAGRRWPASSCSGRGSGKYKDGKVHPDHGPQHDVGGARRVRALVRLVRVQPGSTMAADWASIAHIAAVTNMAAAARAVTSLITIWIDGRQAGPQHDAQRLSRRSRGDHGAVRVREHGQRAASSARSPGRSWSLRRVLLLEADDGRAYSPAAPLERWRLEAHHSTRQPVLARAGGLPGGRP